MTAKAASINVETTASQAAMIPKGRDVTKPLNLLYISDKNVRKHRTREGIPELAALIRSQGLLQRLSISDDGVGRFPVEAGGRRLEAFWHLRDEGHIPQDYPIDCTLNEPERASEISLAENSGRAPMHAADEFEAFAKLITDGLTVPQVASRFGVTPLTVERRLVLSKLAPRFIKLFREDKATLDQLMALSLTDDHALQCAAWDSLSDWNRSAHNIKSQVVNDEVQSNDMLALFVGIDAYIEAGGAVRRDLFADDGKCWLQDGALVAKLAQDRLRAAAEAEKEAGWSWVEAHLSVSHSELHRFEQERPKPRKMTRDEAEGMAAVTAIADEARMTIANISSRIKGADVQGKADMRAVLAQAEQDSVNIREVLSLLHASLAVFSAKQLATCGVMVSIKGNGALSITRGLMRPEDRKALNKAAVADLKKAGKAIPENLQKPVKGARATFSERLMHDLTAHKTAALQATLMDNAHVALALVVHSMAMPIFAGRTMHGGSPLQLTVSLTNRTQLTSRASEYESSPAAAALEAAMSQWGDRFPGGGPEVAYRWLLAQDDSVLLDLLAFCAAHSLDAMHGRERTRYGMTDALVDSLDLDMADWWTPTPAKYLDSVSKAQVIEAVTEAAGAEASKDIGGMKKAEAVKFGAAKLDGKRWLPLPLKRITAPTGSEAVEANDSDEADELDAA